MFTEKRLLVIGTTIDYIDLLHKGYPDRVLFVTDIKEKAKNKKSKPSSLLEIVFDLEDQSSVVNNLKDYLRANNIEPVGVVCFDCESMTLAAIIARQFGLHYSSIESIINCRSKYHSKRIWEQNGIKCPSAALIYNENDIIKNFDSFCGPVVLKPLTGSGGELVYYCEDLEKCRATYKTIMKSLQNHSNSRMYTFHHMPKTEDPKKVIVMEQHVPGTEYSCDFIIDGTSLKLLRLSKKYNLNQSVFGSILAYELPARLPEAIDLDKIKTILVKASNSLGLKSTMMMADFIVRDDQVILLEITPRPGGDCLPPLIKASGGFDIFNAALDFAEGKEVVVPDIDLWETVVGLNIIAAQRGILKSIAIEDVKSDSRVIESYLKCCKGDIIELPPEDYDARMLGHIIFKPDLEKTVEAQCAELLSKVLIEME